MDKNILNCDDHFKSIQNLEGQIKYTRITGCRRSKMGMRNEHESESINEKGWASHRKVTTLCWRELNLPLS